MKMNGHADSPIRNVDLKSRSNGSIANGHVKESAEFKTYDRNLPLFKRKDIIWKNAISNLIFHLIALYGFLTFPYFSKLKTLLWCEYMTFLILISNLDQLILMINGNEEKKISKFSEIVHFEYQNPKSFKDFQV